MRITLKTIISAALFIALVGAAIFGAYTMTRNQGHSPACIGAIENTNCATAVTPFEHLKYHIRAIQGLFIAALRPFPFIGFLLAMFVLVLFSSMRSKDIGDSHPQFSIRDFLERLFASRVLMLRWLSLHEKRDPFIICAMN